MPSLEPRTPRIGISACFFPADPKRALFKGKSLMILEQDMARWVMDQGAWPVLIPAPSESGKGPRVEDWAEELDALILQGGHDVAPTSYGELPLRPEWEGDAARDRYEIALIHSFLRERKPVLGVCRGAQILNVALGGTLFQDIATQLPGARIHRDWEIYDQNFHAIEIEPGSRLSRWYGGIAGAWTNTIHHQGIRQLGRGLEVEARCPEDGVIEAIRLRGHAFVYGVQWHPEFQDPTDRSLLDGRVILRQLIHEAKLRRSHGSSDQSREWLPGEGVSAGHAALHL